MTTARVEGRQASSTDVRRARRIRTIAIAVITALALVLTPSLASPALADEGSVIPPADAVLLGDLVAGQTISIQSDFWEPYDATLAYQWWRSPAKYKAPVDGIDQNPGATPINEGQDDTLTLDDSIVGSWIWVVVTGNAPGLESASRVIAGSEAVYPSTFPAVPDVSITGTAKVGYTLTAALSAAQPAGSAVSYQWQRNDSNIPDAVAKTYIAQPADHGQSITVQVKYERSSVTTELRTSGPKVIGAGTLPSASAPTPKMSGSIRVGSVVTAAPGAWPAGTTYTYQWRLTDSKNKTASISGATKSTYTPTSSTKGKRLSVKVTGTAPGYTAVTKTSALSTIGSGVFAAAPKPTISGSAYVGATLKAVAGSWSPSATLTYQWKRNGSAIKAATKSSYKLTSSDYGKKITVTVTAKRTSYTTKSVTSATTATITKPFTKANTPTISGLPNQGVTLTAKVTAWSPAASLTYQWKRDGVAISGATTSTHTLTADDRGKKITVTVTGKRSGYYTKSVTSAATATIQAPNTVTGDFVAFEVGVDIAPGTYVASTAGNACVFERRGPGGEGDTLGDNYYAGFNFTGQRIVTIAAADTSFFTFGCGTWKAVATSLKTSVGDGTHYVGKQLSAGTWKASAASTPGCYVEFLASFTGIRGTDLIQPLPVISATGTLKIPSTVDGVTVKGFTSNGCGTWTRTGS